MSAIIKTLKTTTNDVEQSVYPKTVLEAVVNAETNETLDVILDNLNEKIDNIEPGGGGEIPTDVQEQLDGKVSKSGDTMTGDLTVHGDIDNSAGNTIRTWDLVVGNTATIKGNVNIPLLRDNTGDTLVPIPTAGTIQLSDSTQGITDVLTSYKSFMGSIYAKNAWNNIISTRHRNGTSDGVSHGMYLRSLMNNETPNLTWAVQSAGTWQSERAILDSGNYSNYALPLTGGKVTGATQFTGGLTSTAEGTILTQDYYVYSFDGGGGSTTGYIKFATIKTNNTYIGGIYKMTIHTRNCVGDLLIGFNGNTSEAGANLSYIKQTGNLPQIYIHKSATQTFDLYIYKMAYESCTVSRIDTSVYMKIRTTLTWNNTYVSTVPSDATAATKTNDWTTVLTSSGTSVVSLTLNQGSAYIISISTNLNIHCMLSVLPTSSNSFYVTNIGGTGTVNCSVSGTTLTISFSGANSSMESTCKYIELK